MKFRLSIVFVLLFLPINGHTFTFDETIDSIKTIINSQDLPGVSLAVINVHDSLFWSGGLGWQNIEDSILMSNKSQFNVASLTKTAVALGIMRLVEQNKLSLDSKVSDIAPEIPIQNQWDKTDPITIAMLLEHTTGFDEYRYNNFVDEDGVDQPIREILIRYPNGLKSRWKPGTMFSYSNLNYTVAGYIIEKISGLKFEDFMKKYVSGPLHMEHTRFKDFYQSGLGLTIPYGYNFETDSLFPLLSDRSAGINMMQRPASCMVTSSEDMLLLLKMFITNGKVEDTSFLTHSSLDRIESSLTTLDAEWGLPGSYGLGIKKSFRQIPLFFHVGNAWNQAHFSYNRENGIGFFYMTNCQYPAPEIRHLLTDFLLQDIPFKQQTTPTTITEDMKAYEGFYQPLTCRNENIRFFEEFRLSGNLSFGDSHAIFDGAVQNRKFTPFGKSQSGAFLFLRDEEAFQSNTEYPTMALGKLPDGRDGLILDLGLSMSYFAKSSKALYLFKNISMFSSFILLFSSLLISLVIFVISIFKQKIKYYKGIYSSALTSLLLSFMIYIYLPMSIFNRIHLGSENLTTWLFYIASILIIPSLIFGAIFSYQYSMGKKKLVYKIYMGLLGTAQLYLIYFLFVNNFVNLRLWLY